MSTEDRSRDDDALDEQDQRAAETLRLRAENARLRVANAALVAYCECEVTLEAVSREYHGVFLSEVLSPAFGPHGWDGVETPAVFLRRLRTEALALNAKGPTT